MVPARYIIDDGAVKSVLWYAIIMSHAHSELTAGFKIRQRRTFLGRPQLLRLCVLKSIADAIYISVVCICVVRLRIIAIMVIWVGEVSNAQ